MQKKTETLITGIRSARSRLKKLLAITKDTQMMKSWEASWEIYGKLQQGIDLLTQAIIISEGEDGLKTLLEQLEAKPRKSYYKSKKKIALSPSFTSVHMK